MDSEMVHKDIADNSVKELVEGTFDQCQFPVAVNVEHEIMSTQLRGHLLNY